MPAAAIVCDDLWTRNDLGQGFVARRLGLNDRLLTDRLHVLKKAYGGLPVWVCLDDGEVYHPLSQESLGNLHDSF